MRNLLMIVTGATSLTMKDGSEHPTGFWAEELVTAHRDLVAAGHRVTIATPGGVTPTVDAVSLDAAVVGSAETVRELEAYLASIAGELAAAVPVADVDPADYAAVVLPGGHGPMADLASDAGVGRVLVAANDAGTIIAPFCHGPAALLSATLADGTNAFAGRRLTVFTDEEERTGGTGENTPWWVETALRDAGAVIESAAPWSDHVVVDRNLITGQNPQSSASVARRVLEALAA
ncbi:type 1 glutamine amidotransferase domain-containing protein [Agromyces mariniharenae]|uniref:Type 1 glutamine amidotransferase domain-containing protein n=1 Tax=Agromyces mariniharenae TaxID=2604423 RepID=A0A5S4V536_9MICO|nr:type 1 glutamine amidotransferase domain-containing protein [Agromyces mariniharenae]TYL54102.1 type 1 glutamine amidotransferase domain-containing protein [Agromyces mariniharenae]